VLDLYARKLERAELATPDDVYHLRRQIYERMETAYIESQKGEHQFKPDVPLAVSEDDLQEFQPSGGTGVEMEVLRKVASSLSTIPENFHLHPKLSGFMAKRSELCQGNPPIDWSYAEALAFGTLVYEGTPVRLSGQDSSRGTFSQRHAVLTNLDTGEHFIPLQHISQDQAPFEVFDSLLSEAAVLGFEFGYSSADPLALVLWEAQFGDFANSAQVIIDNFLANSQVKWQQGCDLVLLLPHGYEGQGPEHSSARLERYLTLCAENNMRVCCPSTPAQYFHALRRQMRDAKRIPLVAMTPKSILRHPKAVSFAQEFVNGSFELVLGDSSVDDAQSVRRMLLCTGKVYYDLLAEKEKRNASSTAIVRMEQLYPFPEWNLSKIFNANIRVREVCWVQEEPQNMGAWNFVSRHLHRIFPIGWNLRYVGRPERASAASGSYKICRAEQDALVSAAFE
jgi:2-oxoglutarate dehydrogenase complex dehydrogenase (E1) component-like enzyme